MKPNKVSNFLKSLALYTSILSTQLPESTHANRPTDTTAKDVTYGIRAAIDRQYKFFDIEAQAGIFFPQNNDALTQNITNLEFRLNVPTFFSIPMYVNGDINILLADASNTNQDEFDMRNELRVGLTAPKSSLLDCEFFRDLDFHAEAVYFDQLSFTPNTENLEHSGSIAARVSYNNSNLIQADVRFLDFFFNRAFNAYNETNTPLAQTQTWIASLQINAAETNIRMPFAIKFEYINTLPELRSQREWGIMTNFILHTTGADYEVDFSLDHPVLGTSYSYKRTDKAVEEVPSDDTIITDPCANTIKTLGSLLDLTNGNIDASQIQEQLSCNPLVHYALNLEQVNEFKQAAGQLTNFTLDILQPSSQTTQTGQSLYSLLREIPRSSQLNWQSTVDSLAKFLVLTDQSLPHLHGSPSMQLSNLERRFMSRLSRQAQHYFDTTKGTFLSEDTLVYGPNPEQQIQTSLVAIQDSNIFKYSFMGTSGEHLLDRTLEFISPVSDGINLDVPYQNTELSHQINTRNNFDINEMVRLFSPILTSGIKIKLNHHNSIEIDGFGEPVIEGINISNISANRMLKLPRLSDYKSRIEINEDQIIIHLQMNTDATLNPPSYTVTFNRLQDGEQFTHEH